MLVGSRKYVEHKIIKVAIGNTYLTQTSNITLLGVNINSQLEHIKVLNPVMVLHTVLLNVD